MDKKYRILNLHAENVKKLKVVDITPDPSNPVVTITGRNGQGKSSVLDSILWAVAGKKSFQDSPQPIRDGESKAEIRLDLGQMIVRRTFTEKDSYIFVETADGAKYSKPQDMLNDLFGAISFDPLDFTRQDAKKQYDVLRQLVKLDVDIDHLNALNEGDKEKRRIVNRDIGDLEAQIIGIQVPSDTPDELIMVHDLIYKITRIGTIDNNIASIEADIGHRQVLNETRKKTIADMERQIIGLKAEIEQENAAIAKAQTDRQALLLEVVNMGDVEQMRADMKNATAINQNVTQKKRRMDLTETLKEKEKLADAYTKAIAIREDQKRAALAQAKMPIDGLTFDNGAVFFQGVPLAQISTAEQIKVSTAIAMAMNPELRVIRIKDGSLLDDDSMNVIRTMAAANDFQVWIECVQSGDPAAIIIEDGEVKNCQEENQNQEQ